MAAANEVVVAQDHKMPITITARTDPASFSCPSRDISASSAGLMSGGGASATPTPQGYQPPSSLAATGGAGDSALPSRCGPQQAAARITNNSTYYATAVGTRERDNHREEGQHATMSTATTIFASAASAAAGSDSSTDYNTYSTTNSSSSNNTNTKHLMNPPQQPSTRGARGFPSISFPSTHMVLAEQQQQHHGDDGERERGTGWGLSCDLDISASSSIRSPEAAAADRWSEAFDADCESVSCFTPLCMFDIT